MFSNENILSAVVGIIADIKIFKSLKTFNASLHTEIQSSICSFFALFQGSSFDM